MDPTKTYARRNLFGFSSEIPEGWILRTLDEVGEVEFAERMLAVSSGDPHESSTPESSLEDLRDLVRWAGGAFDPAEWFLVDDERGEIGVVLPQPYVDEPTRGTLFYVGVDPQRRGENLGAALHRFGLACLLRRGVLEYLGSTDPSNEPMKRIFITNGCDLDG